ncbi:MAG: hypothetical protein KGL25_06305, partial [Gammaproteobacteria bacterium]|nr:hypothetical protein [Gammaproteobacteria bacterium]
MNPSGFESLDAALATLPRELRPRRELWPEIAGAIARGSAGGDRRPPRMQRLQWPLALAASVVVAGLAGAL